MHARHPILLAIHVLLCQEQERELGRGRKRDEWSTGAVPTPRFARLLENGTVHLVGVTREQTRLRRRLRLEG